MTGWMKFGGWETNRDFSKREKCVAVKLEFIKKLTCRIKGICASIIDNLSHDDFDKFRRESKENARKLNREILEQWKIKWKANTNSNTYDAHCLDIVTTSYNFSLAEATHHKGKNFIEKAKVIKRFRRSIIALTMAVIVFVMLSFLTTKDGNPLSVWKVSITLPIKVEVSNFISVVVIMGLLLAAWLYASIKEIEVAKYQETWTRHVNSLHMMQTEMVKYCKRIPPYDNTDSNIINDLFMLRILDVLDDNNKKFVENMENKEAQLSELPTKMIIKP